MFILQFAHENTVRPSKYLMYMFSVLDSFDSVLVDPRKVPFPKHSSSFP